MSLLAYLWNFWFRQNRKIRFLLVGGFNTLVSYLLFLLLIRLLSVELYQTALFLSWLLTTLASYLTQKIFVWQTRGGWLREYFRCLLTWSLAYLINAGLLGLLVEIWHLPVWLAQAIAITVITLYTFLSFKYFAFKGKNHEKI